MRNILLFLIVALLAVSCKTEPNFFTVSGEIKHANGEKLYLVELQTASIVPLDSIILDDNGLFSFKGQTDIPKFYAIRTAQGNYISLIIKSLDKISISANNEDLVLSCRITGSEESERALILRKKLDKSVILLDSLAAYYQSMIGKKELNLVKDSLIKASQDIVNEHTQFTKDFITSEPNSFASLMALYQQIAPRKYVLTPANDWKYFTLVDSSLMASYSRSDAVIALHTQIEEIKRQKVVEEEINTTVGVGVLAPEINLPNPEGDTIALSSVKGKYILLDFWASWCRPCRLENPNLVESYKKYHEKGFEIYQVSLDKKKDSWVDAIEKDQLNWIHVSDLQFWNSSAAKLYKVQSIPASFLIDKNGKIIAKNLRGDALEAKLSELFD